MKKCLKMKNIKNFEKSFCYGIYRPHEKEFKTHQKKLNDKWNELTNKCLNTKNYKDFINDKCIYSRKKIIKSHGKKLRNKCLEKNTLSDFNKIFCNKIDKKHYYNVNQVYDAQLLMHESKLFDKNYKDTLGKSCNCFVPNPCFNNKSKGCWGSNNPSMYPNNDRIVDYCTNTGQYKKELGVYACIDKKIMDRDYYLKYKKKNKLIKLFILIGIIFFVIIIILYFLMKSTNKSDNEIVF